MPINIGPFQQIIYLPKSYTITPDFTTRDEGQSIVFTITTTNVDDNTSLYWTIQGIGGTIANADFSSPANAVSQGGAVIIVNDTATFTLAIAADTVTEGTETFSVKLRTSSTAGDIVATTGTITINDTSVTPPTYSIIPNTTALNEGSSVVFTVSTTNYGSGTLYWTVESISGSITNSDFTSPTNAVSAGGSVAITSNSGSITFAVASDAVTEGTESFRVNLRTTSTTGTIVATSNTVVIYDTSLPPITYAISPNFTSRDEGTSVIFTVSTTNFGSGTLYWTVEGLTGTIDNADFTSPSSAVTAGGSVSITSNSGTITFAIAADTKTEGTESFRVNLRTTSTTGTIVATSAVVTINDTSLDPVIIPMSELSVSGTPSTSTGVNDISWSSGGTYIAVAVTVSSASSTNPTIHLYQRSGSSVTYVSGIAVQQPAGTGSYNIATTGVDWNGTLLAASSNVVTVYTRSGSTLTKIFQDTSGVGSASKCKWSPDGVYLAAGGNIYKRNTTNNTITWLRSMATNNTYAWNSSGTRLAVSGPGYAISIYNRSGDTFTLAYTISPYVNSIDPNRYPEDMQWTGSDELMTAPGVNSGRNGADGTTNGAVGIRRYTIGTSSATALSDLNQPLPSTDFPYGFHQRWYANGSYQARYNPSLSKLAVARWNALSSLEYPGTSQAGPPQPIFIVDPSTMTVNQSYTLFNTINSPANTGYAVTHMDWNNAGTAIACNVNGTNQIKVFDIA